MEGCQELWAGVGRSGVVGGWQAVGRAGRDGGLGSARGREQ